MCSLQILHWKEDIEAFIVSICPNKSNETNKVTDIVGFLSKSRIKIIVHVIYNSIIHHWSHNLIATYSQNFEEYPKAAE